MTALFMESFTVERTVMSSQVVSRCVSSCGRIQGQFQGKGSLKQFLALNSTLISCVGISFISSQ